MKTPKIPQIIVFFKASLLPPRAKKAAQAMVAAHIKKIPLAGPTAKNVANPARTPILKESAVRLFIDHISKNYTSVYCLFDSALRSSTKPVFMITLAS
ncbi:hypothetical protein METHB2_300027 [Candidatus Methylobacter favarea]|uniref:Uncharacterized protein n=1 Tax=Candidatus Methylobacter favarea TaxID=2707345 RepID=A0A8S0WAQ4_9GAMM|nr:hypothetical protein METHB2_300027 [Candidatus Methylobacter favarea]